MFNEFGFVLENDVISRLSRWLNSLFQRPRINRERFGKSGDVFTSGLSRPPINILSSMINLAIFLIDATSRLMRQSRYPPSFAEVLNHPQNYPLSEQRESSSDPIQI